MVIDLDCASLAYPFNPLTSVSSVFFKLQKSPQEARNSSRSELP